MTTLAHETLDDVLAALAAPTPAPGGGAAAAVSGAMAAALVEMVAGLSLGKSPDGPDASLQRESAARMSTLRVELLKLADDDADAYRDFVVALRLPKSDDREQEARAGAISAAAERAAEVPLETLLRATAVAESARGIMQRSLASAASDLDVALRFARTAGLSAADNVEVNLPFIEDPQRRASLANRAAAALAALERATQA